MLAKSPNWTRDNFHWIANANTRTEESIPLPMVTDEHLVNILNWVWERRDIYPIGLHDFLEGEARFRQLKVFAQGKVFAKEGWKWSLK